MIARAALPFSGAFLFFTASCASTGHEGPTQLQAASAPTTSASAATSPAEPPPPERTLATLNEQGPKVAAGMRALDGAELSLSQEQTRDLVTADKDTCVRLVWSASTPVLVKLLDSSDHHLVESSSSKDGTLGERGPICVRKGQTIRVQFTPSAAATVRYAAWASP